MRLLGILHYAFAGVVLLGVGALVIQNCVVDRLIGDLPPFDTMPEQKEFRELQELAEYFYFLGSILLALSLVLNLLSGYYLRQARHRMFSLVVAGINCLNFGLGTALGVFTFLVLLRPTVVTRYKERRVPEAPGRPG